MPELQYVMPMAAGPASPTDSAPPLGPTMVPMQSAPMMVSDSFAKDAIISWFRGEFAAANAIIDALCGHLAHLTAAGVVSDYDSSFAAIHRRRMNWIPVIQMQKYHSIAEVAVELRKVAEKRTVAKEMREEGQRMSEDVNSTCLDEEKKIDEKVTEGNGNGGDDAAEEYDSPESEITDSGNLIITSYSVFIDLFIHSFIDQASLFSTFHYREAVSQPTARLGLIYYRSRRLFHVCFYLLFFFSFHFLI